MNYRCSRYHTTSPSDTSSGRWKLAALGFAFVGILLAVGWLGASSVQGLEIDPSRRKLTLGGAFVDAISDFQSFGGEVDEVLDAELIVGEPQTFGTWHGRSMYALSSKKTGDIVGLVTADGGAVKASRTPDGFIELKPASAGFLTRNPEIFQDLYPGAIAPGYTEEVIFEFVDDSGTRIMLGGAEVDRTTSYLFKKDEATGEIVLRLKRDIVKEKPSGHHLDPDVSATFPTKVKFCDSKRDNCVTRMIVKKPGDELRLDPRTRQINLTFNKENLPYWKKYGTAQRLAWACEHDGSGFYVTYREGSMGGYTRSGLNETGTLTCHGAVLTCNRTGPGQKCNFDYRDYLDRPAELALFGLDWFVARKDPHTHYFTLAPDPLTKKHVRIGDLRNLDTIREVPLGTGFSGDYGTDSWIVDKIKRDLCEGSSWSCIGEPSLKVLELAAVGDGLILIDERTGIKMTNVERALMYSLKKEYGWGKRGDFVATLITNRRGAAEVMALKRLNAEVEAPDLLDKRSEVTPEDSVQAMLKEVEREKEREILRVELAKRSRALVVFPKESLEERPGVFGHTVAGSRTMPAAIYPVAQAGGTSPPPRSDRASEPAYGEMIGLPTMPRF